MTIKIIILLTTIPINSLMTNSNNGDNNNMTLTKKFPNQEEQSHLYNTEIVAALQGNQNQN